MYRTDRQLILLFRKPNNFLICLRARSVYPPSSPSSTTALNDNLLNHCVSIYTGSARYSFRFSIFCLPRSLLFARNTCTYVQASNGDDVANRLCRMKSIFGSFLQPPSFWISFSTIKCFVFCNKCIVGHYGKCHKFLTARAIMAVKNSSRIISTAACHSCHEMVQDALWTRVQRNLSELLHSK